MTPTQTLPASLFADGCSGRCVRTADIQGDAWRVAFAELEAFSNRYLAATRSLPLEDYPWGIDPIHCWSRMWEYPYVSRALRAFRQQEGRPLHVADVGAAVTFFTFHLLQEGHAVECLDLDPLMPGVFERVRACLAEVWKPEWPECRYHVASAAETGLAGASVDAVTCISVLEHTPQPAAVVEEFARICRPGGLLVLTMDLGLSPGAGVSREDASAMEREVKRWFEPLGQDEGMWPAFPLQECLTNWTSPASIRRREVVSAYARSRQPAGGLARAMKLFQCWPYQPGQEIASWSRGRRTLGPLKQALGIAHRPCMGVYCGIFRRRTAA